MVSTRDVAIFGSVGFENNNRISEDNLLWLAAPVNVHDQTLKANAVDNRNLSEGRLGRLRSTGTGFFMLYVAVPTYPAP
jgi:hypothetical protein